MRAHPVGRLILKGIHVGDPRRIGIILDVPHSDGSPPYTVRWLDNGHEALVFPGTDASIEPPTRLETDKPT